MLRYRSYAEIEAWRVGRNIMFYAGLGNLRKNIRKPKDLFELEDEIISNSTEATEKQKFLFEEIQKRYKKDSK